MTSESEVIYNLLAVHNVFDGHYPAAYGFLSFINKYTLHQTLKDDIGNRSSARINNATKKRKVQQPTNSAKTTNSLAFKEFVDSYADFLSSLDDIDMSD